MLKVFTTPAMMTITVIKMAREGVAGHMLGFHYQAAGCGLQEEFTFVQNSNVNEPSQDFRPTSDLFDLALCKSSYVIVQVLGVKGRNAYTQIERP